MPEEIICQLQQHFPFQKTTTRNRRHRHCSCVSEYITSLPAGARDKTTSAVPETHPLPQQLSKKAYSRAGSNVSELYRKCDRSGIHCPYVLCFFLCMSYKTQESYFPARNLYFSKRSCFRLYYTNNQLCTAIKHARLVKQMLQTFFFFFSKLLNRLFSKYIKSRKHTMSHSKPVVHTLFLHPGQHELSQIFLRHTLFSLCYLTLSYHRYLMEENVKFLIKLTSAH